jgi:hypothetical protein
MDLALSPDSIEQWQRDFENEVIRWSKTYYAFTAEDIIDVVGLPSKEIRPNGNNAVGATMNRMAKAGYIKKTNARRKARRPSSHGRELVVWIGK